MAADALGRPPFTVADLTAEIVVPVDGLTFVEGAGGPRSPIAVDGDNVALARALHTPLVVLVADAGLGTINAVELSVAAFGGFEVFVILNRWADSDLHRRNAEWLSAAGHQITTSVAALADGLAARLARP
jgi:dethiobiotin synthetase